MQKTTIRYYCDVCGKRIEKVMFTLEYRARFYSAKGERFEEHSGHYSDNRHYCTKCAEPFIDFLGLHMYKTTALLDAESNDNEYFKSIPLEDIPNA